MDWSVVSKATAVPFSLEGQSIPVKVVSVYDGDTVTLATFALSPGGSPPFALKCRLMGIDTPELRSKNEKEKVMARAARDALRGLVLNEVVTAHCGPFDKYGRLLAWLETGEGIVVNDWLIEQGFARSYDGKGARGSW